MRGADRAGTPRVGRAGGVPGGPDRFSLERIVRENNRKEEILKRLEYIEAEKEKLLSPALEKNIRLLSFSMDHVKSSLEKVIEFINGTSREKGRSIAVMVSKGV
jgi:hypothetical protein